MSRLEVEVPKEVLSRDHIELILARWEKKRRGLLGPLLFPDSSRRRLLSVEKVYVPHYLFTFRQSTRSGVEVHYVLIDAVCGFGAFTNTEPEVLREEVEEPVFAPVVLQQKAQERAKDWVTRWNLRKHAFHLKPPELLSCRCMSFHFPFWVAYYQRPSGRVDMEVVDGVRGYLEGGRTKHLIQQGLGALGRTTGVQGSRGQVKGVGSDFLP
ncbi:MAG: hypothetical protein QHH30_11145 [candidate division NC10 bacterium]|nr:hypothetical protein [candidate division NC10 bacterium]